MAEVVVLPGGHFPGNAQQVLPAGLSLQALIDDFIANVCAGKTNETPIAYRRKLAYLVRFFGPHRAVATIAASDVESWRRQLLSRNEKLHGSALVAGQLSPFTCRTTIQTVRHFFGWAADTGRLPFNPAADLYLPAVAKPDPKAIAPEMVDALLEAVAKSSEYPWLGERNQALIYLLVDTGGRATSIAKMQVEGLHLAEGRIEILAKGARRQVLYVSPVACQALRIWLRTRARLLKRWHVETGAVFLGRYHKPLTRQALYCMLQAMAKRTEMAGRFNPHAFRHAFARESLQSGKANLAQVSQLMGHSSTKVTSDYYARWDDKELKHAHDKSSPALRLAKPGQQVQP